MENNPLKIIIEQNVPFLEPLDNVAAVTRLPYDAITPEAVRDADALIVRTRNRCDAALLEGSRVKFIASATIGTDHIDLSWCAAHGIKVVNAPGSNAPGVAQYVFSSLMRVINRPLSSYVLGIVGVGHVGSIVQRWAQSMNMKVMLCDPPRQKIEGGDGWHTLSDLARESDIITFHTPLTTDDPDATFHLAGGEFFRSLRRAPIIINSARGGVVENAVWAQAIEAGICGTAIVDCWEGEPDINRLLLQYATVATPHIAGYTFEGKQRASQMALDALCCHFGLPPMKISGPEPAPCATTISPIEALRGYDPMADTAALKTAPESFEHLRNTYVLRPELRQSLDN